MNKLIWRFAPLRALALACLLALAVPLSGCTGVLRDMLGLPSTEAQRQQPWEKPRAYVKTLANTLEDVAKGYVEENKAGRLSNADLLAAQPKVNAARKALEEANGMLRSATTDRELAAAALDDQAREAYLAVARVTEAAAVARAAAAEQAIRDVRPALDRARAGNVTIVGPTPIVPKPSG